MLTLIQCIFVSYLRRASRSAVPREQWAFESRPVCVYSRAQWLLKNTPVRQSSGALLFGKCTHRPVHRVKGALLCINSLLSYDAFVYSEVCIHRFTTNEFWTDSNYFGVTQMSIAEYSAVIRRPFNPLHSKRSRLMASFQGLRLS